MRGPINRELDEQYSDDWQDATTHLSCFLALAGYRGRKWIIDSEWHLLGRIYVVKLSTLGDLTRVKARLLDYSI